MVRTSLNKQINEYLLDRNIPITNQGEDRINMNVVVRRYATKGFARTYGLELKQKLTCPVIEYYYIHEELKRPLLNENHIIALDIARGYELEMIKEYSYDVFEALSLFFKEKGYILAALKMIFVRDEDSVKVLIKDIEKEDCLLWKIEKA